MDICPGRIRIDNLDFGELTEKTPMAALAKLGSWLQRAALSLQNGSGNLSRPGAAVVMLPIPVLNQVNQAVSSETSAT